MAALLEAVGAEPSGARHTIRKIKFARFCEVGLVMGGHNVFQHPVHPFFAGVRPVHSNKAAADAKNNGRVGFQVDIGCSPFDGDGENFMKCIHLGRRNTIDWARVFDFKGSVHIFVINCVPAFDFVFRF